MVHTVDMATTHTKRDEYMAEVARIRNLGHKYAAAACEQAYYRATSRTLNAIATKMLAEMARITKPATEEWA